MRFCVHVPLEAHLKGRRQQRNRTNLVFGNGRIEVFDQHDKEFVHTVSSAIGQRYWVENEMEQRTSGLLTRQNAIMQWAFIR
jgi:hypothetical protein